ncbi:MAG TPA: hypothetical protein VGL03_08445 [Thermoanaerobaculia bacterium]|jgi:hypothetical protein
MKRLLLLLFAAAGCAATAPPAASPPPGGSSRAPYDGPPAAGGSIEIALDMRAAREILAILSRTSFDPSQARLLESLPAVRATIQDSNRSPEVFERDLAAAFDEQRRIAVFDFRKIREEKSRWEELLAMIATRETELTRLASERARALLPPDHPVSVAVRIYLSFGLSGLADHLVLPATDGGERPVVIDLARALTDVQASPPPEQIKHLSRLIAGEAYRRAWDAYRASSPVWQTHDPALGQLEPLLHVVAQTGPAALYAIDENFFPLSVWLKEPMKGSLDELNRVADRLVSTEGDLDQRVALAAEVRRPDFASRVAGPAGAFLADGIIQTQGLDAYRTALSGGPRAFFEAYDRASQQKGRQLIPLAKVIHDRLAGAPAQPRH